MGASNQWPPPGHVLVNGVVIPHENVGPDVPFVGPPAVVGSTADRARDFADRHGIAWHQGILPTEADIDRVWAHWEQTHPGLSPEDKFELRNHLAFIVNHWRQCMGIW